MRGRITLIRVPSSFFSKGGYIPLLMLDDFTVCYRNAKGAYTNTTRQGISGIALLKACYQEAWECGYTYSKEDEALAHIQDYAEVKHGLVSQSIQI